MNDAALGQGRGVSISGAASASERDPPATAAGLAAVAGAEGLAQLKSLRPVLDPARAAAA